MTAGAPGNLRGFSRRQTTVELAVKLGQRGKGNMVKIKVKPHSDGIGRNQVFDLAILEHLDLSIAGARA